MTIGNNRENVNCRFQVLVLANNHFSFSVCERRKAVMSLIYIVGHKERKKKIATVTLVKFLVVVDFEREREKSN